MIFLLFPRVITQVTDHARKDFYNEKQQKNAPLIHAALAASADEFGDLCRA